MIFHDHFSSLSTDYARHRPRYPDALFHFLAEYLDLNSDNNLSKPHLVWDCATGSGQAATALAQHFPRVIATDASGAQIDQAEQVANIEYRVARAEDSGLETASVALCTVAQALHWFDWTAFYAEVRRVVRRGGLIAAWTYTHSTITPEIDAVMQDFYQFMRPYFPPERRWVDEEYATIDFPFTEISTPDFFMEASWNLEDVVGYYRSWSGVSRYQTEHGSSPISRAETALREVWQQPKKPLPVRWKLHLRLGIVEGER